nr:MAG TPA: hypothetical protein [Caudoviricetes sp.]
MLLKVDVSKNSISEMFDFLESVGDFIICNKNIYIDTKNERKVKKYFKLDSVNIINEQNYKTEDSEMVVGWLKDKLIKQEFEEYEKTEQCQAQLRKFSEYMDALEAKKFGGVETDERNEKAGTDSSC